ncbi:unnamed protein product [Coregonus sp. 'balchen']|nr:unnamed protein product [Coregonus sp. 'balchen']
MILKQETVSLNHEEEEKEDARRNKQQHASRIPAFHKTLAKKTPYRHQQQSKLRSTCPSLLTRHPQQAAVERCQDQKLPSIRETGLPLPTVRLHKLNPQTLSHAVSSPEQSPSSLDVIPAEGHQEQLHPMTATPRPALRAEAGDYDDPIETSLTTTETAQEDTEEEFEAEESLEIVEGEEDETDLNQSDDDGDDDEEETPCEAEAMEIEFLLEEDGYGLDSPLREEKELEEPSVETESFSESEVVSENRDKSANEEKVSEKWSKNPEDTTDAGTSVPSPRAVPQRTTRSSQSNKTSWCWSFALFCLFPSTLLVIGGLGQHVWHYGMPLSLSQLMGQLELHWLEGLWLQHEPCNSDCRVSLVESVPEGLFYPPDSSSLPSISETWTNLLTRANRSVDIAAFYFTLRDTDLGLTEPSAVQGKQVFKQLMELEAKGVKLQITVNGPRTDTRDTADLSRTDAEVREVDLQSVTGGIIHTKLWVVDQKHLYLGSANVDWRALLPRYQLMDAQTIYPPSSLSSQTPRNMFWPAIDSAIRAAACTRRVEVNLLVSYWSRSPGSMFLFLQSLTVLNRSPLGCNINVKVFEVPSTAEQKKIPFSRVNHAKYMEPPTGQRTIYTHTAGVGLVVNQTGSVVGEGQRSLQTQLHEVFLKDWTSQHAQTLSNGDAKRCGR